MPRRIDYLHPEQAEVVRMVGRIRVGIILVAVGRRPDANPANVQICAKRQRYEPQHRSSSGFARAAIGEEPCDQLVQTLSAAMLNAPTV